MAAITSMITAIFMYAQHLEIILLDILEVVYGTNLELNCSCVVANDDAVLVELENADCPHLCNTALNCMVECLCLVVTVNEDENLLSIHNCANTYCYRCLGNLVDVVVEEA